MEYKHEANDEWVKGFCAVEMEEFQEQADCELVWEHRSQCYPNAEYE